MLNLPDDGNAGVMYLTVSWYLAICITWQFCIFFWLTVNINVS